MNQLYDGAQRSISYLRISVTDRCNLRCRYCTPEEQFPLLGHGDILTYEEIILIIKALVPVGIDKIRLTGGEPLVRRGLPRLIACINDIEGIRDVSLTTNGVLLAEMAGDLRSAGLGRVNVSLDTLKAEKFLYITRRDDFLRVMAGIDAALAAGFAPVKLNVVAMRGFNDDEILDFVALSIDRPVQVRFIEYMPIGSSTRWQPDAVISAAEIRMRIEAEYGRLMPVPADHVSGPARLFTLSGGRGMVGFVSSLSDHFCDRCNRVRITADGRLRPCLLADLEYNLKKVVRNGADAGAIRSLFAEAVANKTQGHGLSCNSMKKCTRLMSTIGG
ncbi:MAG: GTP 3',8-cyclase MoaA [Deltaproteobacteria bacterium]|nr:GTP 3',8-cyclase MoaA [Candidatus Anaeroferrophillus wilburensis]MBN2888732.1 GTP 3',8-cyclase MoaA [Deltaproteobacteria bacterium]